jgi:hypothetical protein
MEMIQRSHLADANEAQYALQYIPYAFYIPSTPLPNGLLGLF